MDLQGHCCFRLISIDGNQLFYDYCPISDADVIILYSLILNFIFTICLFLMKGLYSQFYVDCFDYEFFHTSIISILSLPRISAIFIDLFLRARLPLNLVKIFGSFFSNCYCHRLPTYHLNHLIRFLSRNVSIFLSLYSLYDSILNFVHFFINL